MASVELSSIDEGVLEMRLVLQQGRCTGPQGTHLPLGVIEVGWHCDASLGDGPASQGSIITRQADWT